MIRTRTPLYILIAAVAMIVAACSGDEVPQLAERHFRATFQGELDTFTLTFQDGVDGYMNSGFYSTRSSDTFPYYFAQASGFLNKDTARDYQMLQIRFWKGFNEIPDSADWANLLSKGTITYKPTPDDRSEGVEILFIDTTGKNWSTVRGKQTGSTFEITSHERNTSGADGTRYLTKGTFTCKLYDDEQNVMTLKDGQLSIATIIHN